MIQGGSGSCSKANTESACKALNQGWPARNGHEHADDRGKHDRSDNPKLAESEVSAPAGHYGLG
jgi:hypothetical protein